MSKQMVGGASSEQRLKGALKEFFRQLDDESLRVEHVIAVNEHRNPFAPEEEWALRLRTKMERILSKKLDIRVSIDSLPPEFTLENLERWATMNFRPVFFPGLKIGSDLKTKKGWVQPEAWFYQQIVEKKIAADADTLKRGWYLADFSKGVDYTDGTQVFPNDPLTEIISHHRAEKKIGKYDNTPLGSRFSITSREWEEVVCPAVREALLGVESSRICRPESCVEHNFIGNVFDSENRGRFNIWQWFGDKFGQEGSAHLLGGYRVHGGLAHVFCDGAGPRAGTTAARPLVEFRSV